MVSTGLLDSSTPKTDSEKNPFAGELGVEGPLGPC